MLTLNFGFEVRILVNHLHLLFPVKLVPPIRDHLSKIVRVEAIIKAAILQWIREACLINASL